MATKQSAPTRKPVLVTTAHKGVFFGYANGYDGGENIDLTRCRMAVYWSPDVRGVLGLASSGPTKGCKIGPEVPAVILRGVTAVFDVTAEAIAAWEKQPWG